MVKNKKEPQNHVFELTVIVSQEKKENKKQIAKNLLAKQTVH